MPPEVVTGRAVGAEEPPRERASRPETRLAARSGSIVEASDRSETSGRTRTSMSSGSAAAGAKMVDIAVSVSNVARNVSHAGPDSGADAHHFGKRWRETVPLSMDREVFITCAVTGAGDTVGRSDKVPVTPSADRRRGDRSGEGRRGDRPHPCARPRDRQRRARPEALSRGGRAHPRVRHRRGDQPHRRHGRRPDARLGRKAAAAGAGGHRHGRRDRAARACRRAACRRSARSIAAR